MLVQLSPKRSRSAASKSGSRSASACVVSSAPASTCVGLADEVGGPGARVLLDGLALRLGAIAHDLTSSRSRSPSSSSAKSDLK